MKPSSTKLRSLGLVSTALVAVLSHTLIGQERPAYGDLIKRLNQVSELVEQATKLIRKGDLGLAQDSLRVALEALLAAKQALAVLQGAPSDWGPGLRQFVAQDEDLVRGKVSIVKVRIVRVREELASKEHRWAALVIKLLDPGEDIWGEVLEVHTVGNTVGGILSYTDNRRRDLLPGRTIQMYHGREIPNGQLEIGQDYWMVISPAYQKDFPFGILGGGYASHIRYAEQSKGRVVRYR